MGSSEGKRVRQKGEVTLHEDPGGLRTAALKMILGYLIFSGAKVSYIQLILICFYFFTRQER